MKKKKILLLIVAISLCVLIISIAAAVKSVKKRNNNKSALTTVEIVSNQTTSTNVETASVQTTLTSAVTTEAKATEKTKSEANSVTEKKTYTAPKVDPIRIKNEFHNAMLHYTSLEQGIHTAIGIDYNKDYRDELLKTVCEQTDWTEMGIVSIYKFKTVKSAAEVKEIYKRYISDDVVDKLLSGNSNFFSYNNELYIIEGAKGTYDYDASSITYKGEKDGGYVVAIDRFLGNGAYLATESFLVKYIDGNFKIVKKLGEEKRHPTDYYSPNYSSLLIFDW